MADGLMGLIGNSNAKPVGQTGGYAAMKAPQFYKYVKSVMEQRGTLPSPGVDPVLTALFRRTADYAALNEDFDTADFINQSMQEMAPMTVSQ